MCTNQLYIYSDSPRVPQYIQIYKSLLRYASALNLTLTAVLLYSILRNRANLSFENGWCDDFGHVYVIYTREDFMRIAGCSKQTAIKAFRALIAAGLTVELTQKNRNGYTTAPRIFVKQWNEPSVTLSIQDILNGKLPYLSACNIHVNSDSYLTLPSELLKEEFLRLSIRSKILYAHILDMTQLSLDYGRVNKNGQYWCEIDAAEAQSLLNCGHNSLSRAYTDLSCAGLISREKAEYGCPVRTYLHPCWCITSKKSSETPILSNNSPHNADISIEYCVSDRNSDFSQPNSDLQSSQNATLNHPIFIPQESANATQENLIELSSSIHPHEHSLLASKRDVAFARTEFYVAVNGYAIDSDMVFLLRNTALSPGRAQEILTLAVSIMAQDSVSVCRKILVGGEYIDKYDLIASYRQIDRYIMVTLLCKLVSIWTTIAAPVPYLRTALYHAYEDHSAEAYFTRCRLENAGLS